MWQASLEAARTRMQAQVATAAETTRTRVAAARASWSDAEQLRSSVEAQYASAASDVKDVIKLTFDIVFAEAALPQAFAAAVKSLATSKAIDSDPIAFVADAGLVVRKGANLRKDLTSLALTEAGAIVIADVVVGRLMTPLRQYVRSLANGARATALREIERATSELLTLQTIEAALGAAFEREIRRAKAYVTTVTPQVTGTWQSNTPTVRFFLQCSSGRCVWRDSHTEYPSAYTVEAMLVCQPGGRYVLERPNNDAALAAQGVQPTVRAQVTARQPSPSTLTLTRNGSRLNGRWRGLLIIKDRNAQLKELKYKESDYEFDSQ